MDMTQNKIRKSMKKFVKSAREFWTAKYPPIAPENRGVLRKITKWELPYMSSIKDSPNFYDKNGNKIKIDISFDYIIKEWLDDEKSKWQEKYGRKRYNKLREVV